MKKPVGYRSPFKKKASPLKLAPWLLAIGKFLGTGGGQASLDSG